MALTKITKSGITDSAVDNNKIEADAVDATKIADNAISEEHLDETVFTGNTELSEVAASNDILLVYDASDGTIKKILASNVGTQAVTLSSVSPTNALSGDGTGNFTFTITGTNLTGASAVLVTNSGTEVNFDSVTVDSATQITAVIAKSSITNANEPYDVKVYGSNGLTAILRDQINVDASPAFVTASGSLGTQLINTGGSFSVNATDPESAGNVTFELQSGALPPGYSITNTAAEGGTAIISGTDSTTSSTTTFNFVLRAVDAASNTSSRSFSIISRVIVTESFTSSGTFSIPSGIISADVLVVAGGGSGGQSPNGGNGAGGAGGLIFFPSYPITPGGTITVTVGSGAGAVGGPNRGCVGQDSKFGSPGDPGLGQGGVLTAKGGGGGGIASPGIVSGQSGGSGGGAGETPNQFGPGTQPTQPGNSGAYGFGFPGGDYLGGGYSGGGGGGAGEAGKTGGGPNPATKGNGGIGKAYTIADGTTPVYYAGGGGAGNDYTASVPAGCGGQGGGGQGGGGTTNRTVTAGQANKGGGGGGGTGTGPQAGSNSGGGGKGIVIVRY